MCTPYYYCFTQTEFAQNLSVCTQYLCLGEDVADGSFCLPLSVNGKKTTVKEANMHNNSKRETHNIKLAS